MAMVRAKSARFREMVYIPFASPAATCRTASAITFCIVNAVEKLVSHIGVGSRGYLRYFFKSRFR